MVAITAAITLAIIGAPIILSLLLGGAGAFAIIANSKLLIIIIGVVVGALIFRKIF